MRPDTFTRTEQDAAAYDRANTHTDRPDIGDIDDWPARLAPWPKLCGGSWDVQHETPAAVSDCPSCAPGWDEPPC